VPFGPFTIADMKKLLLLVALVILGVIAVRKVRGTTA
jgi:hypothetical protein